MPVRAGNLGNLRMGRSFAASWISPRLSRLGNRNHHIAIVGFARSELTSRIELIVSQFSLHPVHSLVGSDPAVCWTRCVPLCDISCTTLFHYQSEIELPLKNFSDKCGAQTGHVSKNKPHTCFHSDTNKCAPKTEAPKRRLAVCNRSF